MQYATLRIIHDMLTRAAELALEEYRVVSEKCKKFDEAIYEAESDEERLKIGLEYEKADEQRVNASAKRSAINSALEDFESHDWR